MKQWVCFVLLCLPHMQNNMVKHAETLSKKGGAHFHS